MTMKPPFIQNLPYTSIGNLFKGRDDVISKLKDQLDENKPTTITKTQIIQGLGGIGKTRLAVEFAWWALNEKKYKFVFFINAESPKSLHASLASLSVKNMLNLTEQEASQQNAELAVLQWLIAHKGWLMIFDGVDTNETVELVEDLLPQLTSGHVIITSRFRQWSAIALQRSLGLLEPREAKQILLKQTAGKRIETQSDEEIAEKLAQELGYLPLALEQAAAYISHIQCSFADYLHQWDSEKQKVLEWYDERLIQYPTSLAITYQRTFEQLGPPSRALLHLSAFLAPDMIPSEMFDKSIDIVKKAVELLTGKKLTKKSKLKIDDILAELSAYSMITRQKEGFTVHRILQEVIRSRIPEESRPYWIKMSLQIVNDFALGNSSDIRTWPIYDILRPHAELIARTADQAQITEPTSRLMNELGCYLHAKGLFREAEHWKRRALEIDETSFGPDHPKVANRLNNLAALLRDTNRLSEAELMYRRALKIDGASFGPDHLNVAIDLNNLAELFKATNRLSEAEPMYRRVVEILENLGRDRLPNYAGALNNLAELLRVTNRLSEAEPIYRRVVEIFEKSLGQSHPNVATALNNLAGLLEATNRLSEAEPMHRRVVEIFEKSLGQNHPNVATVLNNLAGLLESTNRFSEAEPLYRRALKIDEASFGTDHPNVARDLNNLARLLHATNRLSEAEPLMRRGLEIEESSKGPNHPYVAIQLNNLASLLKDTNRLTEAESMYRRVVDIFEKSLGLNHPNVATALNNLAELLRATNRLSEAEPLYRRSLKIDEVSFGPDHPDVATDLNNLALLLKSTGRLSEAESMMRRALKIDEASFGPDHPNVATDLKNLAELLRTTNRLSEAEPMMRRALKILEDSLGPDHPTTQTVRNNLQILK